MSGEESVQPESPRRDCRSWARRRLAALLAAAALLLAFGFIWPFDPEGPLALGWAAFMVRTFVFHAGVALMAIALLALLLGSRAVTIAAIPLIAFCVGPEWSPRLSRPDLADPTLSVMSINLLAGNSQYERAAAQIRQADADLVLIQEYGPNWDAVISETLAQSHPYTLTRPRSDAFGVAVYSKVPLTDVVWFELGGVGTPQVSATIEHDGQQIALYAIHLMPPAGLANTRDTWRQLDDLARRIESESMPVMVAGDFNFTPRSAQAARLRRLGLTEAHAQGGSGRGATWPANGLASLAPGIRLDQVYVDKALGCDRSRVLAETGSDHLPILVDIGFRSED